MNTSLNFSQKITISTTTNFNNIKNSNWINHNQEFQNKFEEVYQQFLKSQKLMKNIPEKLTNNYVNRIKRKAPFTAINENIKNITTLTTQQIQAFTPEQIKAFTTTQISVLIATQIQALTKTQI